MRYERAGLRDAYVSVPDVDESSRELELSPWHVAGWKLGRKTSRTSGLPLGETYLSC
jgi:hypothetical protein